MTQEISSSASSTAEVCKETSSWYQRYYAEKGKLRNDLLRNPEVTFQALAAEVSITRSLTSLDLEVPSTTVLDVGCGDGSSLVHFLKLGFTPGLLHGIDILEDRISEARRKLPDSHFLSGDAAAMPYEDSTFDVVFESTMFVQLTDEALAMSIAKEMLRVTKPGGYLLLSDWRYSKPGNTQYRGLTGRRIEKLFQSDDAQLLGYHKGALIPPVGRFLSKYAACCYFPTWQFMPFLVGQRVAVVSKPGEKKAA